jgi:hypothetical protein
VTRNVAALAEEAVFALESSHSKMIFQRITAVLCAGAIPIPIEHLAIFKPVRAQGCVDVQRVALTQDRRAV